MPTRELCVQVSKEIDLLNHYSMEFKVAKIIGGTDYFIQERILKSGTDVIVGTPGRLIDVIERKWLIFD